MNLEDVAAEIGDKLDTIAGLRVFRYVPDKVPHRAAVVGLPDDITFDETYGRGSDAITIPLWVLVDKTYDRSTFLELAGYLSGSGAKSIKAAVDSTNANPYTSCDTVTVMKAEPGAYTWGGADMVGAEFTTIVTGPGS